VWSISRQPFSRHALDMGGFFAANFRFVAAHFCATVGLAYAIPCNTAAATRSPHPILRNRDVMLPLL
jgi:hypothetical protein